MATNRASRSDWLRRWIILAGAIAVTCVAIVFIASRKKPPPTGVERFSKSVRVEFVASDPADAQWKLGYDLVVFAKLSNGEIVAPVVQVERPRFSGFMGGIRVERVWEATSHGIHQRQPAENFPVHDKITQYDLLVRQRASTDQAVPEWRIWLVPVDRVRGHESATLQLPDIQSLPLLSERADQAALLAKERAAREYVYYLDER